MISTIISLKIIISKKKNSQKKEIFKNILLQTKSSELLKKLNFQTIKK